MMEEQVQLLSKLITQQNPLPASPSLTANLAMNKCADAPAGPQVETETVATSGAVHDIILIDDEPTENAMEERTDTSSEPGAVTKTADVDAHTEDEVADVGTDGRTDKLMEPDAIAGPDHAEIDNHGMNKAVDTPADVFIGNSVETLAGGLGTMTTISTTAIEDEALETSRTTQATETG